MSVHSYLFPFFNKNWQPTSLWHVVTLLCSVWCSLCRAFNYCLRMRDVNAAFLPLRVKTPGCFAVLPMNEQFGICVFRALTCVQYVEVCVKVIEDRLIMTSNGRLRYVAEWKNGRIEHKMDHLACFIGRYVTSMTAVVTDFIYNQCNITTRLSGLG